MPKVAEKEGFEPSERSSRSRELQSRALVHSAISPVGVTKKCVIDNKRLKKGQVIKESITPNLPIAGLRHQQLRRQCKSGGVHASGRNRVQEP